MKESFDQQEGHSAWSSTGSRQAGQSGGSARSSTLRMVPRSPRDTAAKREADAFSTVTERMAKCSHNTRTAPSPDPGLARVPRLTVRKSGGPDLRREGGGYSSRERALW